jgi:hypothetical protein
MRCGLIAADPYMLNSEYRSDLFSLTCGPIPCHTNEG